MPMKNPAHPGRIVRSACLEPLGLSVTAGAKVLGVTRQTLNKIVNGKSGISAEMAIRLAKGVRQHGGDVGADAGELRSCAGPQGRKQNQGSPSARTARIARAVTPEAERLRCTNG